MKLKYLGDGREFDVEIIARDGAKLRAKIDGSEFIVEVSSMPDGSAVLSYGGQHQRIFGARERDAILIAAGPLGYRFRPIERRAGRAGTALATPELTAPMPGKVLKVLVEAGQNVAAGQPLVVLEAMKMETALSAESAALVKKIHVAPGQMVDHGAVLLELSPAASHEAQPSNA
jgi:biotin carboxyl carrier protein